MTAPAFGLFAFGPQADGQGDTVSFDYFTLDGQDPDEPCDVRDGTGSGDEFDSGSLDKTKWNAIVREDPTLYTVQNGQLNVTTVNGDIYTNGDPAPTRNFFLQTADHAGAGLGDRDEGRRARAQRRLRAGRPAGLQGRRQLHQVRHHLRRPAARS